MVLTVREGDRVTTVEQPGYFVQRLSWQEHLKLRGQGWRLLHSDERQSVAVRSHHAHGIGLQHQLCAVEKIPRVLTRDRETRLRDHPFQASGRECGGRRAAVVRRRRKLARRQRLHPRFKSVGGNRDALTTLVFLDANLGIGQCADNFIRRERQDAGFDDRGVTAAPETYIEIRGQQ
jgi:hypothetical protein